MSDKKTIQVNMDLFNIPGKTRKKKEPAEKKDIKIKNSQQNKTTKNKLLKYIREQQEKNYAQLFDSSSSSVVKPQSTAPAILANSSSDFEKSVAYMKTVEEENKKKEQQVLPIHNATIKHKSPMIVSSQSDEKLTIHNINTPVSPVSLNSYPNLLESISPPISNESVMIRERSVSSLPQPSYGCLKNGNLPTYRSMLQQTMKHRDPISSPNSVINIVNPNATNVDMASPISTPNTANQPTRVGAVASSIAASVAASATSPSASIEIPLNTRVSETSRNDQLKMISELNQLRARTQEAKQNTGVPKNFKYLKRKKTLRRTYNVGKSKVHPNVSVLVTNRTIRKKISTQAQQLKKMPIEEIRKYLTQKGLIKVGSIAPNDVLRQMYENAILIGADIQNHNPENLLHNYLNGHGDPHH